MRASRRHRTARIACVVALALLPATPRAQTAVPPHIQEANRKVEAQAAARQAATRQAELNEVARLTQNLSRARVEFGNQLRGLESLKQGLQGQLAAARTAQDKAAIENTTAQIANVDEALRRKTGEVVANERRMALEIEKAQAAPRAAETARRVDEARDQAARVATMEKQLEVGQAAFQSRIETIDTAIRERTAAGDTAGVEQLQKDRAKVTEAQQAWTEQSQSTLGNFQDDLRRTFTQNRNDGIGPTSTVGLRSELRQRAVRDGTDPEQALDLVDYGAVYGDVDPATGTRRGGTAASAAAVAAGAPRSTTHLSIFNEVNSDTLLDFANDYAKEARVTYGSWEGFKNRVLKGYIAGVGEGVWDVFKDLVELITELGDTVGEEFERRLEQMTGTELNYFGDENLEKLRELLGSADRLVRNEDGAGLEEARRIVAAAEAIKRVMTRKAEQAAANGEKGLQESLRGAGWGAAQVLVDPLALAGDAVKAGRVATRAVTGSGAASDAARAGARAAGVAEDATAAGRAGERAAETAAAAPAGQRVQTGVDACKPVGRAVRPGTLTEAEKVRRRAAAQGSNIVGSHAEVFSDVAKNRNEVVLVRPVNQHSTRLIADNYATKGMGIKGKSSDWGPHAGTIPVDPRYSKLGNPAGPPPNPDELKLYENLNLKALGKEYVEPPKGPDGQYLRDANGNYKDWEVHKADESKKIAIEVEVPGPDGKPIKVLGDPVTEQPITADYDLFAVGNERGPGAAMSGHREMGSISGGEIATSDAINSGVKTAGYEGGNVVHHGPANRFENKLNPKSDFPITAFTPDGNVHTLANAEDLNDFYNTWNSLGYNLEAMPGWKLDPNLPPSGRFGPLGQDPAWAERARSAGVRLGRDVLDETGEFVDSALDAASHSARASSINAAGYAARDCEDPIAEPEIEFVTPGATTAPDSEGTPGSGGRTQTGGAGGTSGTALQIGSAGFDTVPPIRFEFGGSAGQVEDDTFAATGQFFGRLFGVEVEQVYNFTGNNPFDPRDPLAAVAGDASVRFAPLAGVGSNTTISLPPSPVLAPGTGSGGGGVAPPATNPFASSVGAYNGNGGCGVNSTNFSTQGTNAILLTLPGNGNVTFSIVSSTQANSQSTNLVVFGLTGHSCEAQNIQPTNFGLFCRNGGGGTCLENFNR